MHSRSHHIPYHFHHHHWNMEIVEYYIYQTIYRISMTMVNLYLPIYLFDIGYKIWQIAVWYGINTILAAVFILPGGKILNLTGLKKGIAMKLPVLAIFFYLVQFLSGNFITDLPFIIFILGIRTSLKGSAEVGEELFLAKFILKKSTGTMLGWLKITLVTCSIIAPFLGGLISYKYDFYHLFWTGIVLLLISGIPLFMTHDKHFKFNFSGADLAKFSAHKLDKNLVIAEFGRLFPETLVWFVWPLFLYAIIDNTADIGAIISLSAFISMGVAFYIGKKVDHENPKKLLKRGVRTATSLFFIRSVSLNPFLIGIIDSANNALSPLLEIPYNFFRYSYIGSSRYATERATAKQFISNIFCALICFLIAIFAYFAPVDGTLFFVLIFALFSFFYLLMQKISKTYQANPKKS